MTAKRRTRAGILPPVVKDGLRRQIGDAARALREPTLGDAEIHRARKLLKKARAELRLLQPALGKRAYKRDNAALRDASRPLSALRDAKIMIETIDALAESETNARRKALLVKARGKLEHSHAAAWQALSANDTAAECSAALDRVWRRVESRRLTRSGSCLREGLQRIYRKGRNALKAARAGKDTEVLHEWRKQVKHLANAIDSLDPASDQRLRRLASRLDGLAKALGDEHDLVVLEAEIMRLHTHSHARSGVLAGIADRRSVLRDKALNAGRKVYKAKPGAFSGRMRGAV